MAVIAEHSDVSNLKKQVDELKKKDSAADTEKAAIKTQRERKSIDINTDIKAATSRLDAHLRRTSDNLRSGSESLKEKMKAIERQNAATQGLRPSANTP